MPVRCPSNPVLAICALLSAATLAAASARADIYSEAVAHAGTLRGDIERDALDHPREVRRLAHIRPGMRVADFLAADGYYSQLLCWWITRRKPHRQCAGREAAPDR